MQHDEPQRPASRPSLLSTEPAADANGKGILSDLDGGRKKKTAPASAHGAKRSRKGLVWGGAALLVALLGGATAWVIDGPQSGTVLAQMEPAPGEKAEPLSSPEDSGTVALADRTAGALDPAHAVAGAGEAANVVVDAPAATTTGAQSATTQPGAAAPESAPGNSADIVAALAAPSLAKAAAAPAVATIQDAPAAEREQSLHEMLNGPAPVRKVADAKPAETKAAKKKARERDTRVAAQAKAKSSAPKLAKASATTRKKEMKPATVKDNDVELLAALVAHTRPAKQPESLSSRLKRCRQLGAKGAEQCRARACANAADDQQCKPPVSLAKETPEA